MNHNDGAWQFSFEKLDVWQVMLEAMERAHAVADALPVGYGELADQMRRASRSMVGNFAEGLGKRGKDRLRYHGYSLASAYETAGHLIQAHRLRLASQERYERLRALLLRVVSMLSRMAR